MFHKFIILCKCLLNITRVTNLFLFIWFATQTFTSQSQVGGTNRKYVFRHFRHLSIAHVFYCMSFTACLNTLKLREEGGTCINHDGSCCSVCMDPHQRMWRNHGLDLRHANVAFGFRSECDKRWWERTTDREDPYYDCDSQLSSSHPLHMKPMWVQAQKTAESIRMPIVHSDTIRPQTDLKNQCKRKGDTSARFQWIYEF